jgi:DNA invertase Pin-like site-specific DNA recombinase
MFEMMGVLAEFEHAMIRERVLAGLARAREEGTKFGRKPLEDTDAAKVAAIRHAPQGHRHPPYCAHAGVGVGRVLRVTG